MKDFKRKKGGFIMQIKDGKFKKRYTPKLQYDSFEPKIEIPDGFFLIVDTREQDTLFDDIPWVINQSLKTGDYSVKGFEKYITIERKNLSDLYGSLGIDRVRFMKVVERMKGYPWKGLVIEGTEDQVLAPQEYSDMSPNSVYHSLCSMELGQIHLYFAKNRDRARWWVLSRLTRFYRHMREGRE
jgi:ERCC4-type nuclease